MTGTAVLDFGAAPPTDYASVTVTGQTGILTTSKAEAFFMGSTTSDSTEEDHLLANVNIRLACTIPTLATGFVIHAFVETGLTKGTYNVQWVWS